MQQININVKIENVFPKLMYVIINMTVETTRMNKIVKVYILFYLHYYKYQNTKSLSKMDNNLLFIEVIIKF